MYQMGNLFIMKGGGDWEGEGVIARRKGMEDKQEGRSDSGITLSIV